MLPSQAFSIAWRPAPASGRIAPQDIWRFFNGFIPAEAWENHRLEVVLGRHCMRDILG